MYLLPFTQVIVARVRSAGTVQVKVTGAAVLPAPNRGFFLENMLLASRRFFRERRTRNSVFSF